MGQHGRACIVLTLFCGGWTGVCLAQPSAIQIFGKLNVDVEKVSLSTTPGAGASAARRLSSNSSSIGLRGVEQLGDGWETFFQIEGAISADTGGGDVAGKDTFIGLRSRRFGSIAMGRESSIIKKMSVYLDRFEGSGIEDDSGIGLMGGEASALGFNRRSGNTLRYETPDLGGATLTLQRSSETEDGPARSVIRAAWLQFGRGPIKAAAAYEEHADLRPGFRDDMLRLALNYAVAWGEVSLGANRVRYGVAGGTLQRAYLSLSGAYHVSAGAITARLGRAGEIGGSAPPGTTLTSTGATLVRAPATGARYATIGYVHRLSPRTLLYGYHTRLANEHRSNVNFGTNPYGQAAPGSTVRGLALGVVHRF